MIQPLVIIPGLFGSTANWRSFAAELSELGDVFVVDMRNHGRSFHAEDHRYEDMVGDMVRWLDHHHFDSAHIIGHSMGGKVGMCLSHWHADRVKSAAILDIAPRRYEHSHAPFIQAMLSIDLAQLTSRSEADSLLQGAVRDKATRMFLLQNLTGSVNSFKWRINLEALLQHMPDIVSFPSLDSSVDVPTLLVYGERSDYVAPEDIERVQALFTNLSVRSIPSAGHWLHVEQGTRVRSAITDFLRAQD